MRQKNPLAGAYDAMMQSEAWKDLEKWALEEEQGSMKRLDLVPAEELNVNIVCEERGKRKGILRVLQHANQCREGV